jgi:hypothetical protein
MKRDKEWNISLCFFAGSHPNEEFLQLRAECTQNQNQNNEKLINLQVVHVVS